MAELSAAVPIPGAEPVTRGAVTFIVLPQPVRITVRGRDADPALTAAVARVLGTAPPETPNTVTEAGGRTALWLAPGSWRILGGPDDDGARLTAALREAVPRTLAGIVDVSDAYTTIRIAGPQARETLLRGCPLDLHERAFGPGQCAQSLLARIDVLLHQRYAVPTYDIEVRRSLAPYLWSWLTGAPIRSDGLLGDPHGVL